MVSTASFSDRLRRILRILNIPVRDRWSELEQEDNIYSYWQGLNLLDADSVQQLRECHAQLQPTAVIQRFFRNVDYYWSPGAYAGRSAADLGSGYGHLTMWLLISGARDVLAIGDAIRISFIERLHQAAVAEGLLHARSLTTRGELLRENHRELHPEKNGACLALVLMNDTLEHINPRARRSVFDACFRSLVPGGLLISRQHNTDCPRTLARLRVTWDEWEQRRYLPARMEVIHSRLGGIDAQALRSLAQATRGCDSHALADVIEQFQRGGSLPVVRGDAAPIDIATDEVCEGMTGINTILHELAAAGFKAHAYPAMRESRRSALFQSLARAAPALFLKLHVFDDNTVFVATKSRH